MKNKVQVIILSLMLITALLLCFVRRRLAPAKDSAGKDHHRQRHCAVRSQCSGCGSFAGSIL